MTLQLFVGAVVSISVKLFKTTHAFTIVTLIFPYFTFFRTMWGTNGLSSLGSYCPYFLRYFHRPVFISMNMHVCRPDHGWFWIRTCASRLKDSVSHNQTFLLEVPVMDCNRCFWFSSSVVPGFLFGNFFFFFF